MALAPQLRAVAVAILKSGSSVPTQGQTFSAVDSSNTIVPRITDYLQRAGSNVGDLIGWIHNTNGGAITLVSLEYSEVGLTGPWLTALLLHHDDSYKLPSVGAFNLPVDIPGAYVGDLFFRLEITSILGNQVHIAGPFPQIYNDPTPLVPETVNVPQISKTGEFLISWSPVTRAEGYEVQESRTLAFDKVRTAYSGPNTSVTVKHSESGDYYYRVRAWSV